LGEFIREEYIAVGEPGLNVHEAAIIGDLTHVSEKDFESMFEKIYGNYPALANAIRVIRYKMNVGDIVIVASDGYIYAVGEVVGNYRYREEYMALRNTERYLNREEALEFLIERGIFVIPALLT